MVYFKTREVNYSTLEIIDFFNNSIAHCLHRNAFFLFSLHTSSKKVIQKKLLANFTLVPNFSKNDCQLI